MWRFDTDDFYFNMYHFNICGQDANNRKKMVARERRKRIHGKM